jgi:hypothetical protein
MVISTSVLDRMGKHKYRAGLYKVELILGNSVPDNAHDKFRSDGDILYTRMGRINIEQSSSCANHSQRDTRCR